MKVTVAITGGLFAFLSIVGLAAPVQAEEGALASPCADVEVILARGSGQELGAAEMTKFRQNLALDLGGALTLHWYELGSESQDGYQYPAVNVSNVQNGNALGAFFTGGEGFDYGASVDEGVSEMVFYATNRAAQCPGSRFVFAGYSQGAQVVGESLASLNSVEQQTDFVAFFGDPKLYLPEGEGWRPAACQGKEYSPWRRVVPDCKTDDGSLGARKPYLSVGFINKTGLWCNNDDFVCGSSIWPTVTSGHMRYAEPGNGAELAALEAATRIDASLGGGVVDHVVGGIGESHGNNLDVVFLLDTTGSMSSQIAASKQFASEMADAIEAANGRVALVTYRDAGDVYTARIDAPLTDELDVFKHALNLQYASGGGDYPEATLHALMTAFDGLDWRDGATKAAILLTDAGYHDPDRVDGSTRESVAARSLEIDPVNVYAVVPSYLESTYAPLTQATSGKVIVDSGSTADSLMEALTQITDRPVALLRNNAYEAGVGEEITFDASDSYGVSAQIATYDWDFEGDGVFDAQTTSPVIDHTYAATFDGSMQVRVTDAKGGLGSASVPVRIGQPAPEVPTAPTVTVAASDTLGQVTLSWSGSDASEWVISVDDFPLGYTTDNPVTITDIPRDRDVTFTVTPIGADGTLGDPGSATLASGATATLYSAGNLTLTNSFTVSGQDGSVVTAGDLSCNSSVAISGDVTVAGDAYLTNTCSIGGDLIVGGNLRMNSSAAVAGSIRAVGNVTLQSSNRIGGDVQAAGTVTSIDGSSDDALHAAGAVGGNIERGVAVTAPNVLAEVGPPATDPLAGDVNVISWKTWLNQTATANNAPSWAQGLAANPGCTMASGAYSVNGASVPIATATVIDARATTSGCGKVSLQGMTLDLSGDLTIVSDGLSTIGSFHVSSADGKAHELRIVSQASSGIELAAAADVDPLIHVSLESVGKVTVHSGADLQARVRAGTFRSDGTVTFRAP